VTAALRVRRLAKRFAGIVAQDGVDLEVEAGSGSG
jgi:ABC-type branched-subunit amino acid transport system ATPase component